MNDTSISAQDVIDKIIELDRSIIQIRCNNDLSPNEKVEQIGNLFEQRNQLCDELQNARAQKLHQLIDYLNLSQLHASAIFPSPKRCTLEIMDEQTNSLLDKPPPPNGIKKIFSSKKTPQSQFDCLIELSNQRDEKKKNILNQEIAQISKKKDKSPTEMAHLLRVKLELELLSPKVKTSS